jgi:transposase
MQSIQTWAGIDVSAKSLEVRRWRGGKEETRTFTNDSAGHRELIQWLGKRARICVEATGVYHLQMCLAAHAAKVEVMVVNPRVAKDFAGALSTRSKTDKVDAATLLEYVRRMEFGPWEPPRRAVLELRELGRRIAQLVRLAADEKNRRHAKTVASISEAVVEDVQGHIRQLEKRIQAIEKRAVAMIETDQDLREQYRILMGITGIGRRSAVQLLTELAVLDPEMTVRQIVAHAGLDPRKYESGTSVDKPVRISKVGNARIRAILFMIALSAVRHDRNARRFYAALVGRGKKPMQALVALMRKLLHGIWIVLQRRVAFDSAALFPLPASLAQAESSDSAVAADQPKPEQDHPQGRSAAEELRQQLDPDPAEATHARKRKSKAA